MGKVKDWVWGRHLRKWFIINQYSFFIIIGILITMILVDKEGKSGSTSFFFDNVIQLVIDIIPLILIIQVVKILSQDNFEDMVQESYTPFLFFSASHSFLWGYLALFFGTHWLVFIPFLTVGRLSYAFGRRDEKAIERANQKNWELFVKQADGVKVLEGIKGSRDGTAFSEDDCTMYWKGKRAILVAHFNGKKSWKGPGKCWFSLPNNFTGWQYVDLQFRTRKKFNPVPGIKIREIS